MTPAREVRDLVLHDAIRLQPLAGRRVPLRRLVLRGHGFRAVSRAVRQQLAAQPRIFIHLQHVHAHMRNAALNRHLDRLAPTRSRLPRQSDDQIHVDLLDARRAHPLNLAETYLARVHPPHRARLRIHKRLHPEAHAVHPQPQQLIERLVAHLPGRALDGDLRIRRYFELAAERRKDPPHLLRAQQARRPSAEVDRIHPPRQLGLQLHCPRPCQANLRAHPLHVPLHPVWSRRTHTGRPRAKYPRGKVAVAALRPTERHRDIRPQQLLQSATLSNARPIERTVPTTLQNDCGRMTAGKGEEVSLRLRRARRRRWPRCRRSRSSRQRRKRVPSGSLRSRCSGRRFQRPRSRASSCYLQAAIVSAP